MNDKKTMGTKSSEKNIPFFLNSHRDGKLMSSDKTKYIMFNYNYKYI
jgi:hypothetical protein